MDADDVWLQLAAIIGLLALSAFFSSVESAFFSLSRSTLDRLKEASDPRARRVAKLLEDPRRLLASILSGNTIVNTVMAAIAVLMASDLAVHYGLNPSLVVTGEIIIITLLILFVAELTPKLLALSNPEKWAINSSGALYGMCLLLSPVAIPLSGLAMLLSRLLGIERHNVLGMTEEEIRALVQVGHERGILEAEERQMIHSIFEFGDTIAREVMVPRTDMAAVDASVSLDELKMIIAEKGHSRIPVYEEDIDHITGMLHAKDLLSENGDEADFNLSKKLRSVHFVPEEKKLGELLRELQREKKHLAIIIDEYGGTSGLVTLEDIIEEIVGEIQDEYDKEKPLFSKKDEWTTIVSGTIPIDDFNEAMGIELLSEDEAYDTLAGFMLSQFGEVPTVGQSFEFNGFTFIVEEVGSRRILSVKVVRDKGVFESD